LLSPFSRSRSSRSSRNASANARPDIKSASAAVGNRGLAGGVVVGSDVMGSLLLKYKHRALPRQGLPCQAICMSTRSELIRSLVEPELRQQLRRAAEEQDRSLSYTVRAILAEWAQQQRQQGQEQAA
jgi:hypothetical protein